MSAPARETDLTVADELIESAELGADTAAAASAIRIVKGDPSDEEIAALVAVLTAAQSSGSAPADTRPAELWGSPVTMHRTHAPFSPYSFAASRRY
ncbi:acyl-CoA carboxylase subunit epsilon [Rhodococcus sp. RS1C4]|uniref:acyl-CoA carboxylase subunit epsilon n=1 Tax=Nocardiaceae TaxID=85025 RepID=UPI000382198A|nr:MULTISPECIES: acyl-CoA carboxylase subunit epsilon [Rhodococcus]OZC44121.1 acyl-CoA carboxylase subunit epsilon [Rhodococcus sp. RS1C4]